MSIIRSHYNENLCWCITSFVDLYTLLLLECVLCVLAHMRSAGVCVYVSEWRTFCIRLQPDSIFNLEDYFSMEHLLNGMWTVLLEIVKYRQSSQYFVWSSTISAHFNLICRFRMHFSPILHNTTVAYTLVQGASELRVKHDSFFNYL